MCVLLFTSWSWVRWIDTIRATRSLNRILKNRICLIWRVIHCNLTIFNLLRVIFCFLGIFCRLTLQILHVKSTFVLLLGMLLIVILIIITFECVVSSANSAAKTVRACFIMSYSVIVLCCCILLIRGYWWVFQLLISYIMTIFTKVTCTWQVGILYIEGFFVQVVHLLSQFYSLINSINNL